MNPKEIIEKALNKDLIDEDDEPIKISLKPGLSRQEINIFKEKLPFQLPAQTIELLSFCRGFEGGPLELLDFTGEENYLSLEIDFAPNSIPLAADGFGNFWIYDITPNSTDLGPIYFHCHDAPVFLYQSQNLSEFLFELFKMCEPPYSSLIDDVHEDMMRNVWWKNPNLMTIPECVSSKDPVLKEFAEQLDGSYQVIDLRNANPGDGFSWGRCSDIRRKSHEPVYGLKFKQSIIKKFKGIFKKS